MHVKSCFAGRQWQSIRTSSRSRHFWVNLKKCPVNTWLAGVSSNRSQRVNASRWHSVKRQRGQQRWGLGDMDGDFGRGRSCTESKLRGSCNGVCMFINIFSPLAAVNHCFILLFMKWVLIYWHNQAASLAFSHPVICIHFCISLQTVLPQRCLAGVVLLLMEAFRGQWSESCRDPSGTLFIHLWISFSSVVSLHLLAWTSDVAVVLMRTSQISPVLTIPSGESPPGIIQVQLLDVLHRPQRP